MDNVVYVDFAAKRMSEREQFLHYLARELDELDFQDFIEAVDDDETYDRLDADMKDLVDQFWEYSA